MLLIFYNRSSTPSARRLPAKAALIERWNSSGSLPKLWEGVASPKARMPYAVVERVSEASSRTSSTRNRMIMSNVFQIRIIGSNQSTLEDLTQEGVNWIDQQKLPGDNLIGCWATKSDPFRTTDDEVGNIETFETRIGVRITSHPV